MDDIPFCIAVDETALYISSCLIAFTAQHKEELQPITANYVMVQINSQKSKYHYISLNVYELVKDVVYAITFRFFFLIYTCTLKQQKNKQSEKLVSENGMLLWSHVEDCGSLGYQKQLKTLSRASQKESGRRAVKEPNGL
ncbi:hypothetical protein STEG23_032259 [Scotinomys teguina]